MLQATSDACRRAFQEVAESPRRTVGELLDQAEADDAEACRVLKPVVTDATFVASTWHLARADAAWIAALHELARACGGRPWPGIEARCHAKRAQVVAFEELETDLEELLGRAHPLADVRASHGPCALTDAGWWLPIDDLWGCSGDDVGLAVPGTGRRGAAATLEALRHAAQALGL